MIELLLQTLALSFGINIVFFAIAFVLQTDRFTDFAYGTTFLSLVIFLLWRGSDAGVFAASQWLVLAMVVIWAVRLTSYLTLRIAVIKKDSRFDSFRSDWRGFLKFWLLQGLAVWIIMLPVVLFTTFPLQILLDLDFFAGRKWFSHAEWLGFCIWLLGLTLETVADWQKFTFKQQKKNKGKWVDVGVWKFARHPNYLGEMLVWWGLWLMVFRVAFWYWPWGWVSILSPVFISFLLLFVSGVPLLEKQQQKKYGKLPGFKKYKKQTNLLVPLPKVF